MESENELDPRRRRFAKSTIFILLSVMFKRYSSAAILSILPLFLNLKLQYDKNTSTAIFHTYEFLAASFAVVGAIICNSRFGFCKSIVVFSMVFAIGSCVIALGVIDLLNLPMHEMAGASLLIIAICDGCLKPLQLTYGVYQYHESESESISLFIVSFFFMYNNGSILSCLISPILREDVHCFGNDDCFTAAFGISGIFMILVVLLTIVANRYSEMNQSEETGLVQVIGCIWDALIRKITSKISHDIKNKNHWLDYSQEKYGRKIVWESRVILHIMVLYLPMTFFWALFYQQGSRWVFQAVRMNGDLGFYTIKPDQFHIVNPLLVLILLPIFEHILNPLLAKVRINNELRKTTLGGVLAGVAFLVSAVIGVQIESERDLHMMWLLPQYTIMAMGEILVSISMTNFTYRVAPSGLKAILQSFNMLTMGLGNLIVVIVVGSKLLVSEVHEFILFAVLMFVDMVIFAMLARTYKSIEKDTEERNELLQEQY